MPQKKLGHIELQWTCPNCQAVNPGTTRLCASCGAPQPEDVQFSQAARQDLITDEAAKSKAEAGADIHCPYCGARNPAGTQVCNQCGGDLVSGKQRQTGRVVGAYKTGPATKIKCPTCGAENPDTALNCSQCGAGLPSAKPAEGQPPPKAAKKPLSPALMAVIGVVAFLCCGGIVLAIILNRGEAATGTVQEVRWEYSLPIEEFGPVETSNWESLLPSEAKIISCENRYREDSAEAAPKSTEVCGTPYTVDTGGGYADVVQDCTYQVYESYCTYTVDDWHTVETVTQSGNDYSPFWPEPAIQSNQQLGEEGSQVYIVVFNVDGEKYTFVTDDLELFKKLQIGSKWNLEVRSDKVLSVEPLGHQSVNRLLPQPAPGPVRGLFPRGRRYGHR